MLWWWYDLVSYAEVFLSRPKRYCEVVGFFPFCTFVLLVYLTHRSIRRRKHLCTTWFCLKKLWGGSFFTFVVLQAYLTHRSIGRRIHIWYCEKDILAFASRRRIWLTDPLDVEFPSIYSTCGSSHSSLRRAMKQFIPKRRLEMVQKPTFFDPRLELANNAFV